MRVLYSHYLLDPRHPAARMVDEIAQALRGRGHEVVVHRSAGPPPAPADAAKASGAPQRKSWQGLRNAIWFSRALARNRPMEARDLEAVRRFQPEIILARQDAYCTSMPRVGAPPESSPGHLRRRPRGLRNAPLRHRPLASTRPCRVHRAPHIEPEPRRHHRQPTLRPPTGALWSRRAYSSGSQWGRPRPLPGLR